MTPNNQRRIAGSSILAALLALIHAAPAKAIDCAKTTGRTESLICAMPALQAADTAMAKALGTVKTSLPADEQDGLAANQADWIKQRVRACETDENDLPATDTAAVACLLRHTEDRRAVLSGARADAPAATPHLTPVFFAQKGDKDHFDVTIAYPQVAASAFPAAGALNAVLRKAAEGDRSWAAQPNAAAVGTPLYEAHYRIAMQTEHFISIVFDRHEVTGVADPQITKTTVNFDVAAGKPARLAELLRPGGIAETSDLCLAQLRDRYGPDQGVRISGHAVGTVVDNIAHWSFDHDRLSIEFNPDSIGPHALGSYSCTLIGSEAASLLQPGGLVRLTGR